jgi:hypothetical protein
LRQLCTNITKERDSLAQQNATLLRRLESKRVQWHSSVSTSSLSRNQTRGEGDVTATSSKAACSASQSNSITPHSSFESTTTQNSQKETRPFQRNLDYDGESVDRQSVTLYLHCDVVTICLLTNMVN